jgi:hypothetical protein
MDTYNQCDAHRIYRKTHIFLFAALCCLMLSSVANAQRYIIPGTSGRNWVDTRLDLPPGTLIQLSASGEVDVGAGWGRYSPEGTTRFANVPAYPAETLYRYGLVARLTASRSNPYDDLREEWSYGERREYCAERGGHLWLTVNDDAANDNTGEFTVNVSRAMCRREPAGPASLISVYTASIRPRVRSQRFRVGETVIVRVENNTPDAIYYVSVPRGPEIYRGEDLIVQRFDGRDWVNAVGQAFIDEPPHGCIELRGRWNATRQWTNRLATPGTYRIQLKYNTNSGGCSYENPASRSGVITINSETFEVVR